MISKLTLLALLGSATCKYEQFAEGSQARDLMKIHGNMAAVFTPVDANGNLDFDNLPAMINRLKEWGIHNVMVGGTTGESVSFSTDERLQAVQAWMHESEKQAALDVPFTLNVYAHVGMNSSQEAAAYAQNLAGLALNGVKGIFAMPPTYFRPGTTDALVDAMAIVAAGAPELPFWYYHFPAMTDVDLDMFDFVRKADESGKIPNLMGVKFTNE